MPAVVADNQVRLVDLACCAGSAGSAYSADLESTVDSAYCVVVEHYDAVAAQASGCSAHVVACLELVVVVEPDAVVEQKCLADFADSAAFVLAGVQGLETTEQACTASH